LERLAITADIFAGLLLNPPRRLTSSCASFSPIAAFVITRPPAKVEALIKDEPEILALWREATTGAKHLHNKKGDAYIVSINDRPVRHGNARSYTLGRLKRERPDLFERVAAGELSANKAARRQRRSWGNLPGDLKS
jgi:hypothetical protein